MGGAIVVAGGEGKRLRSRLRKPFVRLAGRPMLRWVLEAFEETPAIGQVVVVAHPRDLRRTQRFVRAWGLKKIFKIVPGGKRRSDSVFEGLKAFSRQADWVAIHDAARPLVTPRLIQRLLREARRYQAAIAAVPVVSTVKQAQGGWVRSTLDRSRLWEIQTPQAFWFELLWKAHLAGRRRGLEPTDDAALVEALGHRVRLVAGFPGNIKVTTPEDVVIAEALLKKRTACRVGNDEGGAWV